MALAGLLFVASAGTAQGTNLRSESQDLVSLVSAEKARLEQANAQYAALQAKADAATAAAGANDSTAKAANAAAEAVAPQAGMTSVRGPGLVVTLDDAPDDSALRGRTANDEDLLVHQQDVQAVVNALWLGGASAMMLMDQRVISTSAVRCVGNVLSLQGTPYSPPYTITAIGDPEKLQSALDASPEIDIYLTYVIANGLGYKVSSQDDLTVPAYSGPATLQHARVPDSALAAS